jgi:hypothetical protein
MDFPGLFDVELDDVSIAAIPWLASRGEKIQKLIRTRISNDGLPMRGNLKI